MKRPNILLITTDQQRYDTICAMGYEHMFTPNLDSLVREGCCFPNAYSSNPACIPARHNMITGLTARYHGFDDNYFDEQAKTIPSGLPTFPQLLSDHGYDTIAIGKMHFQPCRRHNGFTKMELMEEIPRHLEDDEYAMYLRANGCQDVQSIHGVRHLLYMMPQRSMIPEQHHGSSWVADRTIHHLKQRTDDRPFLIWSSFIEPHPPFDVPDAWADMYKGKELPPVSISQTAISALAEQSRDIANYPNADYLQRARELYYASISFVDYNIGKIIAQLKSMGKYDNTMIIFTSDHGEMLGDCGAYQKFLPYDAAARIPFIIRYPEKARARSIDDRFIDINDILPTILDTAQIEYPDPELLPGESIFALSPKKDRTTQYLEYSHGSKRWISLRDKRYKYNYYYGGGKEEMFDLISDPGETTNLLCNEIDAVQLKTKERLRKQLIKVEELQGLEGYIDNNQFAVYEDYQKPFFRENNPPIFTKYEKQPHMSLEAEIHKAIEKEPVVNIGQIDLSFYEKQSYLKTELL